MRKNNTQKDQKKGGLNQFKRTFKNKFVEKKSNIRVRKKKNRALKIKPRFFVRLSHLSGKTKLFAILGFGTIFAILIVGKTVDGSIPGFVSQLFLTVQKEEDKNDQEENPSTETPSEETQIIEDTDADPRALSIEEANQITEEGKALLSDNGEDTAPALIYFVEKSNRNLDKGRDIAAYQVIWSGYQTFYNNKLYDDAVKLLDQADIKSFKPVTQNSLYMCYYRAYEALGKKEKADEYYHLAKEAKALYEK